MEANMEIDDDRAEYDTLIQQEDEYFDPELLHAYNIGFIDVFAESAHASIARGSNYVSFANRAGRDVLSGTYKNSSKRR